MMSTCLVNDVFINISSQLKIIGRLDFFFFGKNFSVDNDLQEIRGYCKVNELFASPKFQRVFELSKQL